MTSEVDRIQAVVAARAAVRKSLRGTIEEVLEQVSLSEKSSRRKLLRRKTKAVSRKLLRTDQALFWYSQADITPRSRQTFIGLGYLCSDGKQIFGVHVRLRTSTKGDIEVDWAQRVTLSRHALEALFRKNNRLDCGQVLQDVKQLLASVLLGGIDYEMSNNEWGYAEMEVTTKNGLGFVVFDDDPSLATVTTWVPQHNLRPDQQRDWSHFESPPNTRIVSAVGRCKLPRVSQSIHRRGLEQARFTR